MQYGLSVQKVVYSRSNYIIESNKGQLMLRRVLIPKEQIAFQYEVNQQLIEKGFNEIEKIYATQRNQPYITAQDKVYILQSTHPKVDTDFTNPQDIKGVIEVLAKFHEAGKNIVSSNRQSDEVKFRNMYEYFSKRTRESKQIKKSIAKVAQKSSFERIFMEEANIYQELEERAIALIDNETCEHIAKEAKQIQCIAHNEYTYHAVGKGDNRYTIENLDQCTYNIQLMDLSNVLIKIMQKNNWDINILSELIQTYDTYKTLTNEEIRVLKAMLIFPEKYATICHKYVTSKRRNHYSMLETKWENMSVYQENQLKTIDNIEKNI